MTQLQMKYWRPSCSAERSKAYLQLANTLQIVLIRRCTLLEKNPDIQVAVIQSSQEPLDASDRTDERTNESTSAAELQPSNDFQKGRAVRARAASRPFQNAPESVKQRCTSLTFSVTTSFHRRSRAGKLSRGNNSYG